MTPERLAAGLRHAMELARATAARKQAENALRAEESRFRTLANAIPQLAWMADASGARFEKVISQPFPDQRHLSRHLFAMRQRRVADRVFCEGPFHGALPGPLN
jgi:PAS domain-containing protein